MPEQSAPSSKCLFCNVHDAEWVYILAIVQIQKLNVVYIIYQFMKCYPERVFSNILYIKIMKKIKL